ATIAWVQRNRPDLDVRHELEKFREDRFSRHGAAAARADWDVDFRNWIRRARSKPRDRNADVRREQTRADSAQRRDEIRAVAALGVEFRRGAPSKVCPDLGDTGGA